MGEVLSYVMYDRYLLELDCEGDPAWDCISNMCLWILRLLFTSKEDFQDFQMDRMPGELASLPMHPIDLAPSVPPRSKSIVSRDGHSRTMSDVSFMSTSSYGSQTTYSGMGSVSMSMCTHCVVGVEGLLCVCVCVCVYSNIYSSSPTIG